MKPGSWPASLLVDATSHASSFPLIHQMMLATQQPSDNHRAAAMISTEDEDDAELQRAIALSLGRDTKGSGPAAAPPPSAAQGTVTYTA